MNDTLPMVTAPGSLALSRMSIEDLRAEFARSIRVTAQHLSHLASVWRELESRGEDLSGLRGGLWSLMPQIARGDLMPELVVKYAGYLGLLERIGKLSLAEQRMLLDDDHVTIVHYVDGEFREERRAITTLKAAELKQVMKDRIVSPEDQRRIALGRHDQPAPGGGTMRERAVRRAQREMRLKLSDTLATSVPMAPSEKESLTAHAKAAGVPLARLIRAALVNAGLLD